MDTGFISKSAGKKICRCLLRHSNPTRNLVWPGRPALQLGRAVPIHLRSVSILGFLLYAFSNACSFSWSQLISQLWQIFASSFTDNYCRGTCGDHVLYFKFLGWHFLDNLLHACVIYHIHTSFWLPLSYLWWHFLKWQLSRFKFGWPNTYAKLLVIDNLQRK